MDNNDSTIGVFIDLRKAFDTIDHSLLLTKLNFMGIRGVCYMWIKSYLSKRQQYVLYEACKSDIVDIECGVPQGSVLGTQLFILYINDICYISEILKFILFADDTNIFYKHKDINYLCDCMSKELSKLDEWFKINRLSLNMNKTNYILFSNTRRPKHTNIHVNNHNIVKVESTKFLGVQIDDKLNWKQHITLLNKKLAKASYIIYKSSKKLPKSALLTLYFSLFHPYLTYCVEVWGNCYRTSLQKTFLLQKRVVRSISIM